MTIEAIARRVGRKPSTVRYWLKKHGLRAVHVERAAPRGGIERATLERCLAEGMTLAQMAAETGYSVTGVRHWMRRYGLRTARTRRLASTALARAGGHEPLELDCPSHGPTEYRWVSDAYRCSRCGTDAVVRRRRRIREILVAEAGGVCTLCGYDRYVGALHFHHLDPAAKAFALSHAGLTRSLAKAKEEAGKCILLCANCHAEVEGAIVSLPGEATVAGTP